MSSSDFNGLCIAMDFLDVDTEEIKRKAKELKCDDSEGIAIAIYEQMLEKYGYNLDNPDIPVAFFQTADPAVWATYVLLPLYNYYKEFYAANPTHPNATIESFVDKATTSGEYWLNPIGQLK